jgi:hypothetical protein
MHDRIRVSAGLLLYLLLVAGGSLAVESSCSVKYVSAEHVYLDAGSAAGLAAGSTVKVVRDERSIGLLEVVFTARYSASCKVISTSEEILPGDTVVYEAVGAAEPPVDEEPAAAEADSLRRTRRFPGPGSRPVARPGPRVSGYVAVQWDHSDETADRSLSSDLVSLPFRLRADRLVGGAELRARGTLRHITRSGYSGSTPGSQWRNRIHEVALVRDDRRQDFHFAAGRIGTRHTASAGPFDGIRFDYRVAGGLRLGAFGGFAPDWGDLDFSTDNTLAGLSGSYTRVTDDGRYLAVNLAGVGRYTSGEVSREYLTLTTSWRDGTRLSLLQAAQVDLNRDWRKTGGQSSLELTSLALTGRYAISRGLRVNLGYDDRQPVRTWESRSLPDSLFSEAGRTGWRAGLTWRGEAGRLLSLWASLRDREGGGERTTGWNGSLLLPRLTAAELDVRLAVRGFDGPYLSGWSPVIDVARRLRSGIRVSAEGGYHVYDDAGDLPDRSNTWLAVTGSADLARRWSTHLEYRRDWGDDIAGNRLFLELRRRF